MLRPKLIRRVAQLNPHLYAEVIEAAVDAILNRNEEALIQGDRIELRGFGTFETRQGARCTKRNPRTGAAVDVGEKTMIHFKSSGVMRKRLRLGSAGSFDEAKRPPPAP